MPEAKAKEARLHLCLMSILIFTNQYQNITEDPKQVQNTEEQIKDTL